MQFKLCGLHCRYIENTIRKFYTNQTGTYNAQTDTNGCISGSNLATQTQRHEVGMAQSNCIESYWREYQTAPPYIRSAYTAVP